MHNHSHSGSKHTESSDLTKKATMVSVTIAIIIVLIKTYAWIISDSLSMLSSLVDSALDVLSSLINFIAIRYALAPPDEDHRYGHGKAEDLAALMQSLFINFSGIVIIFQGIKRIFVPAIVDDTDISIIVMIISTILTIGLVSYQKYVIFKTKSKVIAVDSLHYVTDIFVNIAVIFSLIITARFNLVIVDTLIAILIAGYIISSAWEILKSSFDNLMDREFDDKTRQKIIDIIFSHNKTLGIHDLRTRNSGMHSFIQFDLELDENMSLNEAHDIAEEIENNIAKEFPNTQITIHQDPFADVNVDIQKNRILKVKK